MGTVTHEHVTFLLTGERTGEQLAAVDGLRPALFAGYDDLVALRYDFPVVLVDGSPDDRPVVQPLSGIIDEALTTVVEGAGSERIRRHAIRIERAIRALVSHGARGTLSQLWERALLGLRYVDPKYNDSAQVVRAAMAADGELADCDGALPLRMVRHVWAAVQRQKAARLQQEIDPLVQKLRDLLRADFEYTGGGRSAPFLKASVGTGFAAAFDFDAMARMLATARARNGTAAARTTRIHELISVLEAPPASPLVFDSCADAIDAFRDELPRLVTFAKAMAIARLEIEGQYRESVHDAIFDRFGADGLDPQDLAPFPDVLVSINARRLDAKEHALLLDVLSSDLPIKVLVQFDDILDDVPAGHLGAAVRTRQIAQMALGLASAYVLQSPGSHLLQLRGQIVKGMTYDGPTLFSVFSGAGGLVSGHTPYLSAAAAMESRAFPAFVYDPSAGPTWAERFSLDANPQIDRDWPLHRFEYEDDGHQRVSQALAFTMADFMASDYRYGRHMARVKWSGSNEDGLLMLDADHRLHRVLVDEHMARETARCRTMWRSLQELGRASRGLTPEIATAPAVAHAQPVSDPAPTPAVTVPAEPPERSTDEACIETARCSTCNECTTINNRMFRYNADRQAYIGDITAGTYAQLVEAAESCQVAVIHPGKPRNPNEPGLEDLIKRAEPFL